MIRVIILTGSSVSEWSGCYDSHFNGDCHWEVRGGDAQMLISLDTLLGH